VDTTIYNAQPGRVPRFTIMLVSALALGYEILLMRLFSIIQYHHFAYMIISLALLGYGASGTFLVFTRQKLLKYYPHALIANIGLFGITGVTCFLAGQHLLFNPEEILWNYRQWIKLSILYILLALPFFFAANCIGLTFSRFHTRISEIYSADLLGAGLGSLGIIVVLFVIFPSHALLLFGGLAITVGSVAWMETDLAPRIVALLFLGVACLFLLLPSSWTAPAISPYKGLSQQLRISGSRIIEERSSPLGLLTVVENQQVPLRHAPGLSLNAAVELPEQLGVFIDADTLQVITQYAEDRRHLSYLGMITSALPYYLRQPDNVLILGAGTGADVLQAQYFNIVDIEAVELNPQILDLVQVQARFSGGLFSRENVSVHIGEARGYVSQTKKQYDLIQLTTPGSYSSSAAGLYALNENYMYTREALAAYLNHLKTTGFLSINGWVRLPPRDTLKIVATIIESLKQVGIRDPSANLLLIRGWQSNTLLVKRSALTEEEISGVKKFCIDRSFDVAYYPGMPKQEANLYNILQQPYFYEGVAGLLGSEPQEFIDRYKFNITPATDDQPYFSHFFKWRTLPEIIRLKGQGGLALLESGYLVLVFTLVQAVLASIFLILLPLFFYRRQQYSSRQWKHWRLVVYFLAIGFGFLLLEISFIQKFILFLHHPLYAVSIVLASFLIFAGLGSQYSQKKRISVQWPVTGIIVAGIIYLFGLGPIFAMMIGLPFTFKAAITILLIGPLAFCMGMPFPMALAGLGAEAEPLVPWAWAVNGCASVVGAVLATLLAIQFGFIFVVLLALLFYGLAAAVFP
jgi:hypothetical protein